MTVLALAAGFAAGAAVAYGAAWWFFRDVYR